MHGNINLAQAGARGMAARTEARHRRHEAAAVRIQAALRMMQARRHLLHVQAAVRIIQAAYRGRTARALATEMRCGIFTFTGCCEHAYQSTWLNC